MRSFLAITATIFLSISATTSARRWSPLAGFPAHFGHSEPPHTTPEEILTEKEGKFVKLEEKERLFDTKQASRLRYEEQQQQQQRQRRRGNKKEPVKFTGF